MKTEPGNGKSKLKKAVVIAGIIFLFVLFVFVAIPRFISFCRGLLIGPDTLKESQQNRTTEENTEDDFPLPEQQDFTPTSRSISNVSNIEESDFSDVLEIPLYEETELIPEYTDADCIILNDNNPSFSVVDLSFEGELYSNLDSLGRCGPAMAMITKSMIPKEPRGQIGNIKPSGWHTVKYPDLIEDLYLYNRCHLIGYALTGQNANELNLITGTRYLNVSLMLPFEYQVLNTVEQTDNRVLYRVTPYFVGDELVARGVEMEAYSVDDFGSSLCFHVFCYNIQPGIEIDYMTGESYVKE